MWVKGWYTEVQERSSGPWCLLIDNCGGHEDSFSLPGVEIVLSPPRSTAKHQTLDFGLIVNTNMRHRVLLLSATIDVINRRRVTNQVWQKDTRHGKWGYKVGNCHTWVTPCNFSINPGMRCHPKQSSNAGLRVIV